MLSACRHHSPLLARITTVFTTFDFLPERVGYNSRRDAVWYRLVGADAGRIHPGQARDAAKRAPRNTGTFVITTPNRFGVSASAAALILGRERCHSEHTCYYSPQTLRYVVENHGFRVTEMRVLDRPARHAIVGRTRLLIRKMRPLLGDQLVMVASKTELQDKYADKW